MEKELKEIIEAAKKEYPELNFDLERRNYYADDIENGYGYDDEDCLYSTDYSNIVIGDGNTSLEEVVQRVRHGDMNGETLCEEGPAVLLSDTTFLLCWDKVWIAVSNTLRDEFVDYDD